MDIPGYEVLAPIGAGGMATAYLAMQRSLGRRVVLKVLDPGADASPAQVERFLNEGRLVASLSHPNIITIYDVGIADQAVYISMEYVEGGDLKARLEREVFAPPDALALIECIAGALDVAHRAGIVHRDVKPGNILFRRDGTPLLSDFGIAKRVATDGDLTLTGVFLGSPNYMAPEQAAPGPIDGRVDIYALGVILFEMLTGAKPYEASSVVEVLVQHRDAPIPRLPEGLNALQELIELMLAKDRRDRFRDVPALLHYIHELRARGRVPGQEALRAPDLDLTVEDAAPRPASPPAPGAGRARRVHPALLAALVLALAAHGALQIAERRLASPAAALPAAPEQSAPVPPPPSAAAPAPAAGDAGEVAAALAWLARKALDEYRLTSPPKDSAYYYLKRLEELDPGHPALAAGWTELAERFAVLAERELAAGHPERARRYVAIGLGIDPDNAALTTLSDLARPRPTGLLGRLRGLFGG